MKMDFSRVMGLIATRFGDAEAIVNVERNRRYSFKAYHRLTNKIANMMRGALALKLGDVALAIADNDNLTLLHFPTVFKQEATIAFTNSRESFTEHIYQVDFVKPRVVFLESKLLETYYQALVERAHGYLGGARAATGRAEFLGARGGGRRRQPWGGT